MKKMLFVQTLVIVLLYAVLASAADKVVIIPLSGKQTIAEVARTGQAISYGAGDDGALQKGAIWPNPRYTDNADGTVTDNLTGLIWLQNAICFLTQTWATALTSISGLAHGSCDLSDGSVAGDWRIPNRKELDSLIDVAYMSPSLSDDSGMGQWTSGVGSAFSGVGTGGSYWTSTTYANNAEFAWTVSFSNSFIDLTNKGLERYVWAVRD